MALVKNEIQNTVDKLRFMTEEFLNKKSKLIPTVTITSEHANPNTAMLIVKSLIRGMKYSSKCYLKDKKLEMVVVNSTVYYVPTKHVLGATNMYQKLAYHLFLQDVKRGKNTLDIVIPYLAGKSGTQSAMRVVFKPFIIRYGITIKFYKDAETMIVSFPVIKKKSVKKKNVAKKKEIINKQNVVTNLANRKSESIIQLLTDKVRIEPIPATDLFFHSLVEAVESNPMFMILPLNDAELTYDMLEEYEEKYDLIANIKKDKVIFVGIPEDSTYVSRSQTNFNNDSQESYDRNEINQNIDFVMNETDGYWDRY